MSEAEATAGPDIIDLDALFNPGSVAVIGASNEQVVGRHDFVLPLLNFGYRGRIYPVNPKYNVVHGLKCYKNIIDVDDDVDLAIVAVSAPNVEEVIKNCAKKGVKFAHIYASGFKELGDEELERRLVEIAHSGGTRLIGPNCMGIHDPSSHVTFMEVPASSEPGDIAFVSQSGGHAFFFSYYAASRGARLDKVASIGNQCDLKVHHFIRYFAGIDRIRLIVAYIEDVADVSALREAIESAVVAGKMVILWKGGTTDAGARAAASHTGAMASSRAIWEGFVRQIGAIEVKSREECTDVALMAVKCGMPQGPGVALISPGGGNSVELADICARCGLNVPVLGRETQKAISEVIPHVNTSVANPVDLGAFGYVPEVVDIVIDACARDRRVDAVFIVLVIDVLMKREGWWGIDVEKLVDTIAEHGKRVSKPLAVIMPDLIYGDLQVAGERFGLFDKLVKNGIPVYPHVERAALAAKKLLDRR